MRRLIVGRGTSAYLLSGFPVLSAIGFDVTMTLAYHTLAYNAILDFLLVRERNTALRVLLLASNAVDAME